MNWSRQQLLKMKRNIHLAAQALDDEAALETVELFPAWTADTEFVKDIRVRYSRQLYRCLQTHTSQEIWTPDLAPALWTPVAEPTEEWPEWRQPLGSEDAYHEGDKVSHNGGHWISTTDGNVWEPGVYGWAAAPEEGA